MSAEEFMDQADALLQEIRATQLSAIKDGAEVIAESLANGGVLHYYDRGHATGEILHRAGGLFAINHIPVTFRVGGEAPPQRKDETPESWAENEAVIDFVLDHAYFKPGDVLLISSVSGGSPSAVSLPRAVQKRGGKVIAITSPTYSKAITSRAESGEFLYEVADVVIDNRGPVGDAMMEIPGLETTAIPASGLAWVYIVWALLAQVMRNLTDRGITPQVYKSVNLPEGPDFNKQARERYEEKGL